MIASELFQAGRLEEAVAAQVQEVKSNPADQGKRLFLFELLAFAGELERARRQIEALKSEDPELEIATMAYRKLLDSEQARRQLFAAGLSPTFLVEPPEHVKLRLDAVNRLREGRPAEAKELLDRANGALAVRGLLNDKP